MADLLTDNILPVLGLCPPGSLLLPWLARARKSSGRVLDLPLRAVGASFAVAKRVAKKSPQQAGAQAPVAAVLLEEGAGKEGRGQGILVMIDWAAELSPHSGMALRKADPKVIFGTDVAIRQRCLVVLTEDDILPAAQLRELGRRLDLTTEEVGWLGLRSLCEVLADYLGRIPRDRFRAPERTANELAQRLGRSGIRPFRPLTGPQAELSLSDLWPGKRRYQPFQPGTRAFPFRFAVAETLCNEALVLGAQLQRRKALRPHVQKQAGSDK